MGLIVLEPVYAGARTLTGQARPRAFLTACILLATAAHGLLLREAWRLAGRGWRGRVAVAASTLNPFLLLLDSQGDLLDVGMLWTLLAAAARQEEGRTLLSALCLGLSIGLKQLGLLYLPAWIWVHRRRPGPLAVLASAMLLPAVPFLLHDVGGFGFAYSGAASAYRNFVELDWWNVFAYGLRHGLPAGALRVLSWVLTLTVVAGSVAALARRARPLVVVGAVTSAAWLTYYSAYSLYLGWWSTIALIVLIASA